MKTRILNLVVVVFLLFGSANVFAGKPFYYLKFTGKNGIVFLPVKVEEDIDSLPLALRAAMQAPQTVVKTDLVHTQIDLAPLTKPEPEVADEFLDKLRSCEEIRYSKLVKK